MKLRNKMTGEIRNAEDVIIENLKKNGSTLDAISIDEIREEWEDYEEPTDHWHITFEGVICDLNPKSLPEHSRNAKSIGNYFETKEEAEKAVEKLKAWKRLKDKGFRFSGWNGTEIGSNISYISELYYEGCADDMDLLFGGEESDTKGEK